jgi:SPX domain protein involved in polyphosphate accumulation
MKFGITLKENVFDPWRFDYLSYDSIKMDLKARQLDHKWNAGDEAHFKQVLYRRQQFSFKACH